jgi:hypothetical protein
MFKYTLKGKKDALSKAKAKAAKEEEKAKAENK